MSSRTFQGASAVLDKIFGNVLRDLGACALVLPDGSALHVRPSQPADLATLPQASGLCHKYLRLSDGQVAITNDPYSGGTVLSDFTIVMGIGFLKADAEVLLARRIRLEPLVSGDSRPRKIDEEGVRVPPTPLSAANQLNRDILSAIAKHPLAPPCFFDAVTAAIDEMSEVAVRLRRMARDPNSILNKENFAAYVADSGRIFDLMMSKLPLGSSLVSCQLPTGETVKLQLKISEDRIHFDFAGSESSATISMTELATFGACFAATIGGFDDAIPFNAGTFAHFQVSAPTRTLLSATPPAGMVRGLQEGLTFVCKLVQDAFAKISPTFRAASGAGMSGIFQIRFDEGRTVTLRVPPGAGATARAPGTDAFAVWEQDGWSFSELESLDRNFPILLLSAGRRAGSGGNGRNQGGAGAVLGLKMLAAAEFRWCDPSVGRRQEGLEGGRSGAPGAIEILRAADGKREEIELSTGRVRIETGDHLFILSAGGGGYGEPVHGDAAE